MAKRLTQEMVDKTLEEKGFRMLDPPYKNSRFIHSFECEYGHTWETSFNSIKQGNTGCPHCYGKNKKYTEEQVTNYLASLGITLVDRPYRCNTYSHTFQCMEGHTWKTQFTKIKLRGDRCPTCSNTIQSTFVYLMHSSLGVKIGISLNPARRRSEVACSGNIPDLEVRQVYNIPSIEQAKMLEKAAHQHFKDKNCGYMDFSGATEFFDISIEEADMFIKTLL